MVYRNLPQLFVKQSYQFSSRDFLRVKKQGRYQGLSWQFILNEVMACTWALSARGIRAGECVAILSENRPEWVIADLGILGLGAVTVPIYATSTPAEIAYILKHCDAKLVFASTRDQVEKIKTIRSECAKLSAVVCFDAAQTGGGIVSLKDFQAAEKDKISLKAFEQRLTHIQEADIASIIYTSGTTGPPKGVMLTHGNFLSNCEACRSAIPVGPMDCCLSFLPLSHVFERMAGYYYPILCGATISYAERIDTAAENLIEVQPTIVCSVPRLFEKIYGRILEQANAGSVIKKKLFFWAKAVSLKKRALELKKQKVGLGLKLQFKIAHTLIAKKIQKKLGGKLRFFISGGAALPKEIAEFFYAFGILILEGYGLTETSPVVACNSPKAFKFGVVGRPVPGVDVKIAGDGEILVRGPNVMKGYFRNDAATAEAIKEGWFYTGDVGLLDEDGFLKITDRKKDIIVTSGGKNISPQNIEQSLAGDPYITQSCVCGDGKRYITALIVPNWPALTEMAAKEGWGGSRASLIQDKRVVSFFQKRIEQATADYPPYSRIKYFTLMESEFSQSTGELTPTLKLKRKVIARKFSDQIERMYDPRLSEDSACKS